MLDQNCLEALLVVRLVELLKTSRKLKSLKTWKVRKEKEK